MPTLIKDDEKKRNMVRNFRLIKAAEKNRIIEESKCINFISKLNRRLTKHEIMYLYANLEYVRA